MSKSIRTIVFFSLLFACVSILLLSNHSLATKVVSPLPPPLDPFYVESPHRVSPHRGSFIDFSGDRVLTETVIYPAHHEPIVIDVKRDMFPAQSAASLTFESPLAGPHLVYLPLIKGTPPTKIVYSVIYTGQPPTTTFGGGYPVSQTLELAGMLTSASRYHGYLNAAAEPAVRYGAYGDGAVVRSSYPPTQASGYLNVQSIYTQNDLCTKISSGQVDEVWIWADGSHGYSPSEFAINGNYYSVNAATLLVPNCGRTVTTLFLNYDRMTSLALHSYGHTFDVMLLGQWIPYQYQTCDWNTPHLNYWGGAQPQCTGQYAASDTYGFVSVPSAQYNNSIGVCGDTHYPPNLPYGYVHEYDYSEVITATSRCQDWQWGGGTTSQISCLAWQCESCGAYNMGSEAYSRCNERNMGKFFVWWMQNIPGLNNNSHDRFGALRPNYWTIKFQ